jgi:hypothetical protein
MDDDKYAFTVKITGLKEFQDALNELANGKEVTSIVRKAVKEGGKVVLAEMVNRCPKD